MASSLRVVSSRFADVLCRLSNKKAFGATSYHYSSVFNGRRSSDALYRAGRRFYHRDTSQPCHLVAPGLLALAFFSQQQPEEKEEDKPKEQLTDRELLAKLAKEDPIIILLKHAKLAEKKHDFIAADNFYHQSLDMLDRYLKAKTWDETKVLQARIFVYSNMAMLALRTQRFEEAEKLYKETLKGILQQDIPKDDNAVVDISLKLAMIYAVQKRDQEAEDGYRFCVETQEKKLANMETVDDNSMALLGLCIDAYSRFLLVRKEYKKAAESLDKALVIAEKVFGKVHPQVAVLHNDVATIASLQEDYHTAYESAKKAVHIAEACESPDLPTMYANLGSVCIHKSLLAEATVSCQKALHMSLKNNIKETEKLAQACLAAIKSKKQQ